MTAARIRPSSQSRDQMPSLVETERGSGKVSVMDLGVYNVLVFNYYGAKSVFSDLEEYQKMQRQSNMEELHRQR